MATFSINDAIAANIPEADLPPNWRSVPDDTKLAWIKNINGGWRDVGNGNVEVDDKFLASNMDKGGLFDWGDMVAPGMLLLGPFAGMMSGVAAGAGGLGAGMGGAFDMGGMAGMSDMFGIGGAGMGGAGGAFDMGGMGTEFFGGGGSYGGGPVVDYAHHGMTWDSTINNYVDQWGNVVDASNMPGTTPGYTSPTGITPGYSAGADEAVKEIIKKVGPDQAKSVISRILNGTATSDDYLKVGGQLASTLLGVYGANRQANSQQRLSQQFQEYGAPYRARLAESYADPAAFLANSPDIKAAVGQGTDAVARSLSTQGNPAQSGHALQELQSYATTGLYGKLGQERDRLAGFGGLTSYNAAAPGAMTNAVSSQAGVPNAIGAGISAITNPVKTTYQTMMDFFNQPGVA